MQSETRKLSPETFSLFDCHVHVGSWQTEDFLGRTTTLEESCNVLVECGVTGALVMPTDARQNEKLLEQVQKHEGQLSLFFCAWVDPMDDYIFDFIQKNRREVFALKIHPSFARLPVDDKAFYPFFELAQTFSMPVVVHCGRWREVTGYEHVLNVAKMFSNVDFILSHMGGDSPPLVLGAARDILNLGLENCFLGTESIREYWLIERVVKMLGAKKLVFGSDHNLNHPRTFIATIEALRITAEEKSLIFGQNAMALLGKKARISR